MKMLLAYEGRCQLQPLEEGYGLVLDSVGIGPTHLAVNVSWAIEPPAGADKLAVAWGAWLFQTDGDIA
jgi:hypothetical protein